MLQAKTIGCLPTPQQELLLRAALLDGPECVQAFRDWRAQVELDKLDNGSYRLLPLLYKNLKKNSPQDATSGKLPVIYRETILRNQRLICKTLPALHALKDAGIDLMLLKGAALVASHYEEIGLRPMYDIDTLVPTEKRDEAAAILSSLGWTPLFKAVHAQGFRSPDGIEIDLHWHVLLEFSQENSDADFWANSKESMLGDVSVLVPNAADLLFHVCIHGLKSNEISPIRWIADALMILRAESKIDWDRLLSHAKRHRLTLRLREALQYLKRVFSAPIPDDVLAELAAARIAVSERLDYATDTCTYSERGPLLTFWGLYSEYLHWARSHKTTNSITGLPSFLQHVWSAEHLWQVPILAAKGLTRRSFKYLRDQAALNGKHKHLTQSTQPR